MVFREEKGVYLMKRMMIVVGLFAFLCAGCASTYYERSGRGQYSDSDTLQIHPMTKEDVISLVKGGVGDDVIINQIKSTASYFRLSTDDIVQLKNAGVSEKVIN